MVHVLATLILTATVIVSVEGKDEDISCTVSMSPVAEGQPVVIICKFPKEKLDKSKPTYVVRTHPEPEKVLTCVNRDGKYSCAVSPGYYIDESAIEGEVRLIIPSARKEHEGNYTCENAETRTNPCELIITVTDSTWDASCTASPASKGQPANITFSFNKDMGPSPAKFLIVRQPFHDLNSWDIVMHHHANGTIEYMKGDYELKKSSITTSLTLDIASASETHEGKYSIVIESSLPGKSAPCFLLLSGRGKETYDQEKHEAICLYDKATFGSVMIVIIGAVIFAVVRVVAHFRCKKTGNRATEPSNNNDANTPLHDR